MITLILAHDEAGAIGKGDGLPWPRIHEDMARFRAATLGHPVIMGRKTLETLGRPLPWRENIVLTRDRTWRRDDVTVATDIVDALRKRGPDGVFVIGGAQIYDLALPYANRIMLTRIVGTYDADVFWKPDLTGWRLAAEQDVVKEGERVCTFADYERATPPLNL